MTPTPIVPAMKPSASEREALPNGGDMTTHQALAWSLAESVFTITDEEAREIIAHLRSIGWDLVGPKASQSTPRWSCMWCEDGTLPEHMDDCPSRYWEGDCRRCGRPALPPAPDDNDKARAEGTT